MEQSGHSGQRKEESSTDESSDSSSAWTDWMDALREMAPYLDLGWRVAGAAVLPPLIGYGLDVLLQTLPWGLLLGCGVGLAAATLQVRQVGGELDRRSRNASSEEQ